MFIRPFGLRCFGLERAPQLYPTLPVMLIILAWLLSECHVCNGA